MSANELIEVEASAYSNRGVTATGTEAREGVVAFSPKYYGYTVGIWDNGTFLGFYTVEDTGGQKIRDGKCIDIWMPTDKQCFDFGRHKVLVLIMEESND